MHAKFLSICSNNGEVGTPLPNPTQERSWVMDGFSWEYFVVETVLFKSSFSKVHYSGSNFN